MSFLRISLHVYSNNQEQVIEEAFQTYLKAKMTAVDNKISFSTNRERQVNKMNRICPICKSELRLKYENDDYQKYRK